jgi:hypothetical protein
MCNLPDSLPSHPMAQELLSTLAAVAPPLPAVDAANPAAPHPSEQHVRAIRAMVEEEVAAAGSLSPAALLPLGQRVLRRIIPYTERLARSGPARRALMIEALQRGRDAAPEQTHLAFDAALLAVRMDMDAVIVGALQDTRMLADSAPRIATCLLALFRMLARRGR